MCWIAFTRQRGYWVSGRNIRYCDRWQMCVNKVYHNLITQRHLRTSRATPTFKGKALIGIYGNPIPIEPLGNVRTDQTTKLSRL